MSATGNNTGHRAWILDQGLKHIGIGVDNGMGDLYVLTPSDTNNKAQMNSNFDSDGNVIPNDADKEVAKFKVFQIHHGMPEWQISNVRP